MKSKLSKFEAISITCIIMITQIILNIPEYITDLTGTGTITNLIYISIIGFVFCYIISNLLKHFSNSDIIDISEFIGGKFLKFIVSIIFILFLGLSTIIAISNFSYLIKSIYFSDSETLLIIGFFILAIVVSNFRGFYSIKKVICVFIPILIISILLLFLGTIENFEINNFSPIFGYDYSTTFKTRFTKYI